MPNHFDRIFKENIEPILPFLAQKMFGIKIPKAESIKDKIQITLEREADYLKRVIHSDSQEDYILHIEFQVDNSENMLKRMLLYRAFLYHKYELPVKQFVIGVGNKIQKTPHGLYQEDLTFSFDYRNVIDFDYQYFLRSDKPEAIILAILADFQGNDAKFVIHQILERLKEFINSDIGSMKYIRQLEVLSNLRNLQEETIKQVETMPFVYNLETDIRYKQGIEKGIERGIERGIAKGIERGIEKGQNLGIEKKSIEVAQKMLLSGVFSIPQISEFSGLSIKKIEELKKNLKKS